MKLVSLNCNGIRSATSKGLLSFIQKEDADIVSFQEVKAETNQIDLVPWEQLGYTPFIYSATKKGYSGVAVFTKEKPKEAIFGLSNELYDSEGRSILLKFPNFTLVNTYFPSGTSGEERQSVKMQFLEHYLIKLAEWKQKYKKLVICGDVNIAHTEIDIHDPKGNKKNSGFLPEEREWLTKFLEAGMVDTFRFLNPDAAQAYSWWTYRFKARERNKGWRIDYFFTTENLKKKLIRSEIRTSPVLSDHAPIVLELE
jgi:exodeoxyribonuclease III